MWFPFNAKDYSIFPCFHNIRLSYNIITYRNASVLCQSECACLHKTVNTVVFFVKSNENTNLPKMESTLANVQNCPNNEKRKLVIYKFETFVWIWFSTCLIRAANWCGKISMIVEFVKRMPDEVFLFWFSWSTSCLLTLFILFVDQSKYTLIFIYIEKLQIIL